MLISFVKSTPTFPSIASALIEAAEKLVVPVTTKSLACNVLLNEASPTTSKRPPMDTSLIINNLLFILTSTGKLLAPEEATSPIIDAAGIEPTGTLIVPDTVRLFNNEFPETLRSPSLFIVILSVPAVKNDNVSLSEDVSALIYVSWSISITPPNEPHAFPAP